MKNAYFSQSVGSEQRLYEDIIIESLKIYGQETYYLPRDIVNENTIFGDDVPSRFNSSYNIEMYVENTEGFDGEGDLFTRFGVEIRDEATFIVSRKRWKNTVSRFDNEITGERPREGDLIYLPLTRSLFQINHVEHEQPFYQLSNLPVYKMRCQLFEYNDEDLDTGVEAIDDIEKNYAYRYVLTLEETSDAITQGDTATQTLGSGVVMSGEVARWSNSDKQLHLVHVGADDGKFHTFTSGGTLTINGLSFTISSVSQNNVISNNEQNDAFSTFSDDFLDFTEDNPFGDPEAN
jgi:hypothetical protein